MNIVDWAQDNIDFKSKAFMHPNLLLETIDQLVALLHDRAIIVSYGPKHIRMQWVVVNAHV